MAGTIIADYIRADANKISLNVGNTVVASINASGILSNTGSVMIAPNGAIVADNITSGNLSATLLTTGTVGKARLPSGSILQVVSKNGADVGSTSSAGYVISQTFTPLYSSSKVLVFADLVGERTTGNSGNYHMVYIYRDSTSLKQFGNALGYQKTQGTRDDCSGMYLDSPGTTSQVTYRIYADHQTASGVTWTWYSAGLTIMEIAV